MGDPNAAITATVRDARCKDCVREREYGWHDPDTPTTEAQEHFEYNEAWAQQSLERGGSRTDRCPRHRRLHKKEIAGLAVAYIDLQTIGTVEDRQNPNGPLGGLGPLPDVHVPVQKLAVTPSSKFGMTDADVRLIYEKMSGSKKQVLILKAGTGTGKSTFFPFRLLCPPADVDFSFTARGPIVVTEPRIQATVGVARYVGERLVMGCPLMECSIHGSFNPTSHVDDDEYPVGPSCSDPEHCGQTHVGAHPGAKVPECCVLDCARHIGPGYPVGYQVKGDARHDAATQLVYVTDGTMINWLREGRLSRIGTVVVDEAHERSTNIDFIMGYLRREIDRYPHLRVIVTSATFDVAFYESYFGGPDRVESMSVPAQKTFGFGAPLFPITDGVIECGCERNERGELPHELTGDFKTWMKMPGHWPPEQQFGPEPDNGAPAEDLWEITAQLHELRCAKPLPDAEWTLEMSTKAKKQLGADTAEHVVKLVNELEARHIEGDVLAFLPNSALINDAVETIEKGIDLECADVYALIQSASPDQKEAALESRPRGEKRKIVVSTNLAETSLTVSGVRFVVDCALTTQGAWNPTLASKSVPTTLHSQAGVRQRWGRVGRDSPGWVFPLYTRSQFDQLPRNTPAGSTRENLEQLVMKAKAAGIDDVVGFPWPAAHQFGEPDKATADAMALFEQELHRANEALAATGVVDTEGHLTAFGRELERFGQHSAGFAVATILADHLACVPEVVTALNLLEAQKPQGYENVDLSNLQLTDHRLPDEQKWPPEWRRLARDRWQQLHVGCRDDLDAALRIVSLWERSDPASRPWEPSPKREEWARSWWLDHDLMLQLAELRRADLEGLSAAMKEEVKRFLEPRLTPRARAVITRAFLDMRYQGSSGKAYTCVGHPNDPPTSLSRRCQLAKPPTDAIALNRAKNQVSGTPEIRNLVAVIPWAARGTIDAIKLMQLCSEHFHPRDLTASDYDSSLQTIIDYPIGAHVELSFTDGSANPSRATIHPPFGAPNVNRVQVVGEEADDSLKEGAAAGRGSVGWPAGFVEPLEDDERNERLRLEDPENDDRDESSGRSLGIEANEEHVNPKARVIDLLSGGVDIEAPNLRVDEGVAVFEGGWYRCSQYEPGPNGIAVMLERLFPDQIQITDPSTNSNYSLFEQGMLVRGVVESLSDKALHVRFKGGVRGFSVVARLPRKDYLPGEEVIARVHESDAGQSRLVLDLKTSSGEIRATAPAHWQAALRFHVRDLGEALGATVRANGLGVSVALADGDTATATADRLKTLLGCPAAAVTVPDSGHGRVQGAGGRNLTAARAKSGAFGCDFEEGSHRLIVIAATQEQLRSCVEAALAPLGADEPPVRDLFGSEKPIAWRSHEFLLGDATIEVFVDAGPVVDMRPSERFSDTVAEKGASSTAAPGGQTATRELDQDAHARPRADHQTEDPPTLVIPPKSSGIRGASPFALIAGNWGMQVLSIPTPRQLTRYSREGIGVWSQEDWAFPRPVTTLAARVTSGRGLIALITADREVLVGPWSLGGQPSFPVALDPAPVSVKKIVPMGEIDGPARVFVLGDAGQLFVCSFPEGASGFGQWAKWMDQGVVAFDAVRHGNKECAIAVAANGSIWSTEGQVAETWSEWHEVGYAQDVAEIVVLPRLAADWEFLVLTHSGALAKGTVGQTENRLEEWMGSGILGVAASVDRGVGGVLASTESGQLWAVQFEGDNWSEWEVV